MAPGWPVGHAAVPGTDGALRSQLWTESQHRGPSQVCLCGHSHSVLGLLCAPDGVGLLENCPACLEIVFG